MADLDDLLIKTSRTFALTIPLLPEPTRREVTIAYLLFRIADTFEDASQWPRERRIDALDRFAALLEDDEIARNGRIAIECGAPELWGAADSSAHAGYVELIGEMPAVLEAFAALRPEAQTRIRRHTARTARGMAEFVARTGDDGALVLAGVPDLQAYCYVVAGIVGELLTELFVLGRDVLDPIASFLEDRAAQFGEALQLVNILKDRADDALEGRRYVPPGVDPAEVFALARRDLAASAEYVHALQRASAPRGLVEFTALPVLLARATLDRVESAGAGAKLSRPEVAAIVEGMRRDLDSGRPANSGLRRRRFSSKSPLSSNQERSGEVMNSSPRPEFLYLGHSTVLCTLPSGKTILIDPWVDHNPACPAAAKSLPRVDAMLITHAHADHMGDAVEVAAKHKPAQVVACYEIAVWLTGQGVENCVGMNLGGNLDVLGARVSMVRADHSSGISTPNGFVYGGLAAGFVVRLPGGYTFYHAGDTALFSDMELISELYRPELGFLPIGDLFTMDPRHAAIACRLLGLSTVIPIHYATFPALTGTAEALSAALLDRGITTEVVALKPGESY